MPMRKLTTGFIYGTCHCSYRQWYGAERKEVDGVEQLWSLREEQAEDPDSPLLILGNSVQCMDLSNSQLFTHGGGVNPQI